MGWFFWVIVMMFAGGPVLNVLSIGKPRKPLEAGPVALSIIVNALIIFGLFHFWGK